MKRNAACRSGRSLLVMVTWPAACWSIITTIRPATGLCCRFPPPQPNSNVYRRSQRSNDHRYAHRRTPPGIPENQLSRGEDASFVSLTANVSRPPVLPAESLGFLDPCPLVYYIHGGPQGRSIRISPGSRCRSSNSWFCVASRSSCRTCAVPPATSGLHQEGRPGLGRQDHLDHLHAMMKVLPKDSRLDVKRAAVWGVPTAAT